MPRESSKCREWEKERRNRLNDAFMTLCKLLPCYDPAVNTSKIDILKNATTYIEELQTKIKSLISENKEESVKKIKGDELKKLQERVKRLLLKNEQLCSLLSDAKITIPTGCSLVKKIKRVPYWSNRIVPEQAKILQKNELEKENCVKKGRKFANKTKVSGQNNTPKHRKAILNRSDPKKIRSLRKKKIKPLAPSKCVIVLSQPSATQPCYVITNSISNNLLGGTSTVITNSGLIMNPLVTPKTTKTVSSVPPLGPGTLILANGTIIPVLPQQTVLPLAPQPQIVVLPRNSISSTSTTSSTKIVSSTSVKNLTRIKPKYCFTKTTQVNKVPIPALTSRYSNPDVVLKKVNNDPKPVKKNKENSGEKRKETEGENKEAKKAKIVEEEQPQEREKEVTLPPAVEEKKGDVVEDSSKKKEEEKQTKKPEETLDLNINHSELSNDIFASLQVPSGCQNPESTSPTAAFLLAFPLVSSLTGVKVTEVTEEDHIESQRGTPTLLQIGTMDSTKPTQSESLTPSLLNLDNLSFFSSKDFYNSLEGTKEDKNEPPQKKELQKPALQKNQQKELPLSQKAQPLQQKQPLLQPLQQPLQAQQQPMQKSQQPLQQQSQQSLQQPQQSLQQPQQPLQKSQQPLQQSQQSLQQPQQSQQPLQQPQQPLQKSQQSQQSLQQSQQPLQQPQQPLQKSQQPIQQSQQPMQQSQQPLQQPQQPLQQSQQPLQPLQKPQQSLQPQKQLLQDKNQLAPCFENHPIPSFSANTYQPKNSCTNYASQKTFSCNTFNEIPKVSTVKSYPEPLYTNSTSYTYGNSSEVNHNFSKSDSRSYYSLNYENYTDYRKNEGSNSAYFSTSNYYYPKNSNNNPSQKNKRPPINWMTTPTTSDYVLPQFSKEAEFYPTNTQTTYSMYSNDVATNQEPRKSLDLPLVPPTNTYQEENQFSWSPTKIPQFLEPPHSFVSSTLPTLVGDLALGNPSLGGGFGDQKNQKKDRRVKNYESENGNNNNNQSNFLSVSQLVDHNNKEVPARTTTRRNSGNRSSAKKVLGKNNQRKEGKVESGKGMKQYSSSEVFCENKNRSKNSYSAEALIGQMQTDQNQKNKVNNNYSSKGISVSSFLHDNIIPYFPTVDLPPQENTYIQQNQNYQSSSFGHNFPSTFQNNTYTANSFIPPTTTISSSYNFMHDVTHDYSENLNLFPQMKEKNCPKSVTRNQQCPTTPKKSKRKHSNDHPGFVDFPFLSMPASINSPILPDDFHTHTGFLQPPTPQLYPCKNPFTKSNDLGSGSLLPLPPVPVSRSNIQHPEISPSINSAGTSLTNFNLSTIFPEINNKSILPDPFAEPRSKDHVRNYSSTVQVSFNDKPTLSFSYINCTTSQSYNNQ